MPCSSGTCNNTYTTRLPTPNAIKFSRLQESSIYVKLTKRMKETSQFSTVINRLLSANPLSPYKKHINLLTDSTAQRSISRTKKYERKNAYPRRGLLSSKDSPSCRIRWPVQNVAVWTHDLSRNRRRRRRIRPALTINF